MQNLPPPVPDAAWEDPYPQRPPSRFRWLRWLWFIPGLILLALAVLVVQDRLAWPADPEYQGRRLSAWMRDLASADPAQVQAARQAVLALGTNALPALAMHLRARDSALGRLAAAAENRLPRRLWVLAMQGTRSRDALERRWHAAQALAVLGPVAAPALPLLARALEDPEPRVAAAAAEALQRIGPPAWPDLVRALRTTNEYTFQVVNHALSRAGPTLSNVAPRLVEVFLETAHHRREQLTPTLARLGEAAIGPLGTWLADTNAARVERVVTALRGMIAKEYAAVRAVAVLLQHPDPRVRAGAARVLGGPAVWARTSVAALTDALRDTDSAVRTAAAQALAEAASWTDAVTNALPALRELTETAPGAERDAAVSAVTVIASRGGAPAP